MNYHNYIQLEQIKDEIISRFKYDPYTGVLTYIKSNNHKNVGDSAGYLHKSGYLVVKVNNISLKVHRIAWFLYHNEDANGMIDHINGNRCDNRMSNLRVVSFQDNSKNRGNNKNNTSGAKGVVKKGNKYYARIGFNGVKLFIGSFNTLEEAEVAYVQKAAELYAEKFRYYHNKGELDENIN